MVANPALALQCIGTRVVVRNRAVSLPLGSIISPLGARSWTLQLVVQIVQWGTLVLTAGVPSRVHALAALGMMEPFISVAARGIHALWLPAPMLGWVSTTLQVMPVRTPSGRVRLLTAQTGQALVSIGQVLVGP